MTYVSDLDISFAKHAYEMMFQPNADPIKVLAAHLRNAEDRGTTLERQRIRDMVEHKKTDAILFLGLDKV